MDRDPALTDDPASLMPGSADRRRPGRQYYENPHLVVLMRHQGAPANTMAKHNPKLVWATILGALAVWTLIALAISRL